MDTTQLLDLYNELYDLASAGKETEAMARLKEEFPKLPSKVQGEILLRMSLAEMKEEIAQTEAIAKVQKQGLDLIKAIEGLKDEI